MSRLLLLRCGLSVPAAVEFRYYGFCPEGELMAYTSGLRNEKLLQKSQVSLSCSTPVRMWLVSLAAFLVILQSGFTDSFRSLGLAFAVVLSALLTEFLFLYKSGKTAMLKDGSVVASALVFTILLPNLISPVYAVIGIIFAVAVIKHCFGGLGSNWLNPAAGGWLLIRIAWPASLDRALEAPSGLMAQSGFLETQVRPFLNDTVFSFFKTEIPSAYLDLLASGNPGIIADRGILALLLGSILIIGFRACRTWVPVIWIAVFVFLAHLAGSVPSGVLAADNTQLTGDVFTALCTGGTLAAAFILSADPATSAKSVVCAAGAAVAGGFLAWFFRFPGGETYGAIISVIIINALLPVFRTIENYWLYERRSA